MKTIDAQLRRLAEDIADRLGLRLGDTCYTYAETGAAAAYEILASEARLAINAERAVAHADSDAALDPEMLSVIIECGQLSDPTHLVYLDYFDGLGWIRVDAAGNPIF